MIILVMGVSGSGKSTVGHKLAKKLGAAFIEADDFHPPANVEKMRHGQPLDDLDRAGWLATLADEVNRSHGADETVVLACSALKQSYREQLLAGVPAPLVRIVFLDAPPEVIDQRLRRRSGHFMPPSLLGSQFAILERPQDAILIDATKPLASVIAEISGALSR